MKKEIILGLGIFLSLIISFTLVSALGTQFVCLNKGERIYYSDCNPGAPDYICPATTCNLCVDEIRTGVYCPGNGCVGVCEYLYDEPENPVITPPVKDPTTVVLINPVNNYFLSNPAQVTFSFKITRYRFETCELMIDGKVSATKSRPIYFNKQYNLTSSLENGEHNWRIDCTKVEADGGDIIMSETRNIIVGNTPGAVCGNNIKEGTEQCDDGNKVNGDGCSSTCKIEQEQQTEIGLVSPANGYSSTDTQTIDFKFSISSSVLSNIVSCNLMLNNAIVGNITSVSSSQNTISYSVSPASYTWRIDCLDNLHQTTSSISRTLVINSPAPAGTGGNTGGGGGGGGGGGASLPTYTLNQEQLKNGTTQSLQKGARFKFKISNEDHYVTVDEIATIYVQLTVLSEPQKFLLYTSSEKKVDVNNDSVYDISLILNKIESNKANLTIKSISEPIKEELKGNVSVGSEANISQPPKGRLAGITGAVIGGISNNKTSIAIVFVIVLAIVVVIVYNNQKKKQPKEE